MQQVTRRMEFAAAHRLQHHPGLCRNVHGHTYGVEMMVAGDVGHDGMIADFHLLNNVMATEIAKNWDHALILESSDPLATVMEGCGDLRVMRLGSAPTAEVFAKALGLAFVCGFVALNLPVRVVRVRVFETLNSWADWCND